VYNEREGRKGLGAHSPTITVVVRSVVVRRSSLGKSVYVTTGGAHTLLRTVPSHYEIPHQGVGYFSSGKPFVVRRREDQFFVCVPHVVRPVRFEPPGSVKSCADPTCHRYTTEVSLGKILFLNNA